MADRELGAINQSGELQDILLKTLGDGAKLLTKDEIYAILNGYLTTASLGNFTFDGDYINHNDNNFIYSEAGFALFQNKDGTKTSQLSISAVDGTVALSTVDSTGGQQSLNVDLDSVNIPLLTIALIDAGIDRSAITKEWALAKMPSLGNYTFDGDILKNNDIDLITIVDIPGLFKQTVIQSDSAFLRLQGSDNDAQRRIILQIADGGSAGLDLFTSVTTLQNQGFRIQITDAGISLAGQTNQIIDDGVDGMVLTKLWALAKFFQQTQFINTFSGNASEPIVTGLDGKIDSTLIPTQSSPQGNFTPTGGAEYPDITGNVAGDYWVVDNVGAGYTFVAGDLAGRIVYESAWMVLDVNLNWFLSNNYSGTVQTAWGSIIGTLADQTDLNNALGLKADQLDLDTTNTNVGDNTTNISTNTSAIALKSDQSALDTTNSNVSTNTADILTKVDQSALDTTNSNVATNTSNISSLDGSVTQNTANIATNTSDIANIGARIAEFQADSTAPSIGVLVDEFNSLLAKLKASGLMATS